MRLLLILILGACSSESTPRPPAEPVTRVEPVRAKPKHEVLAEKLLAVISAGEVEQLRPLFSEEGWATLADIARESFRRLRARLEEEHIDLAKAKLVRVERTGDHLLAMIDVTFESDGRKFRTHFSAMDARDGYHVVGLANWIKRE